MPAFVEIAQLGKTYETPSCPAVIVRDFTLYVDEGEFICLLGHSGCGKTTVLSILMGLVTPSTGGVVIGGREIDGPGTDRGVVFQSATLLPWMSVRANVRLAREQIAAGQDTDVESYLASVGLGGMGERYPRELSAGMQLQDELIALWEAHRRTVIMVPHDVDEALHLAARIVMMTNGPAPTIGRVF